MRDSVALPDALQEFVVSSKWTLAKTMPEWPHEYIVRERVDEKLFVRLGATFGRTGTRVSFIGRALSILMKGEWFTGRWEHP
jgi:hypothetical protein